MTKKPLILLGAGGHAKVVLSLAKCCGYKVEGVCDPELARQQCEDWRGLPVLGGDEVLESLSPNEYNLANGVGQLVNDTLREDLYQKATKLGFYFPALIHPSAQVDLTATIAPGVQLLENTIVQVDVEIGENTLINCAAVATHECKIGQHVHIAPGVMLCGNVTIEDGCFVGCGANILQGITMAKRSVLAAGLTLRANLSRGQLLKP